MIRFYISLLLLVITLHYVAALLGEPEEVMGFSSTSSENPTDKKNFLKRLAVNCVKELNKESSDPYYWKLERLQNVKKQLVNGIKYKMNIVVARSECFKESDRERVELNLCSVYRNAPKQVCTYNVYIRGAWDGNTEEYLNRGCRAEEEKSNSLQELEPGDDRENEEIASPQHLKMAKIMEKTRKAVISRPEDVKSWNMFSAFVDRYSKTYETKQHALKRFQIYKRNLDRAQMWQANEMGTAVYGETQFMDLTADEFKNTYLPYQWKQPDYYVRQLDEFAPEFDVDDEDIPSTVDWRKKGVVTDVKNQESCGSCWAFSVTGNIEGQWAIKKKKLVSLSEQELVDCDVIDQGCNGGLPLNAYKEIVRMGGLEPESDYPYGGHRETCHLAKSDIAVYINDSVQLPKDESKMAIWLFKNGPISIGVNAYPLQFYRHGISHPWKFFCSPLMLNHGVLIVGYGQENNKPFWVIKNSWGSRWGESGYYRLYRGKNVCGVNEMATSSIIY